MAARPHYFCIESPETCGTVWMAFSEHKWSVDTINNYSSDAKLRASRMQSIDPKKWIASPTDAHACEATPGNLEHVLEYMPNVDVASMLLPKNRAISKADGSYVSASLNLSGTQYPVYLRNKANGKNTWAIETTKLMQASSKRADGKSYPPVLLALWDTVGMARELNGYRNEVVTRIEQYKAERRDQVVTLNQLDGIKKNLADTVEYGLQNQKELAASATQSTLTGTEGTAALKLQAATKPEPQRSQMLIDVDLLAQWDAASVPSYIRNKLNMNFGTYDYAAWQDPKQQPALKTSCVNNRADAKKQADDWMQTHDQKYADSVTQGRAASWTKYETRLNVSALNDFRVKFDTFNADANKLINSRTIELIKWLEAPLFIDTLNDYHTANLMDGLAFNDTVGATLFGIASSQAGTVKLDQWAKEAKSTVKSNLLWRSVALNQQEGMVELDKMLEYAKTHSAVMLTEAAGDALDKYLSPLTKLADLYKKSQSYADAAAKAAEKGYKKFSVLGLDKVVISAGERIYKCFGFSKAVDSVGEKVIQHILSTRAFVPPSASIALIKAQAQFQGIANEQMKQRVAQAGAFVDMNSKAMATPQRDALRTAWKNLAPDKSVSAICDVRLALVVALFEGGNFAKCAYQLSTGSKRDARTAAYMTMSGLAVTALMLDVIATTTKHLYPALAAPELADLGPDAATFAKDFGETNMRYQKLKLLGGVLSASASLIGAVVDGGGAASAWDKSSYGLAGLYSVKILFGAGGAIDSIATGITYAPQLTADLLGKPLGTRVAVAITDRAAAIVAFRLVGIGVGWWATLAGLAITAFIYYYYDDDLQVWCNRCVFGLKKEELPFKDLIEQDKALQKTLGIPANANLGSQP
jgi:hypothetical protein